MVLAPGRGWPCGHARPGLRDLRSASGLDRTAAFSDAVLAIAMTILVLDLKAPDVAGRREYDAAVLAALPRPRFRPRGVDSVMSPGLALRQVGSHGSG
ncbi:TMEM175 family protein [uncultured Actinomyces sp.]|uniref:TMEM175 family protein n=1 Tax=uncultured Actinomyces sp. TaxID=249061 RepID=UPI00288ABE97|nr:TMEM175 family protein [uncultured Actinomyces sp.]